SFINIPSLGGPVGDGSESAASGALAGDGAADRRVASAPAAQPLKSGGTIEGQLAPPGFLAQAGYGPKQSTQVQDTIARINRIVASVEEQWDPKVRGVLDDIRTISSDVREQWPSWRDRVTATLDNIKGASDKFGSITDNVKAGVDDARAVITDNRPRV